MSFCYEKHTNIIMHYDEKHKINTYALRTETHRHHNYALHTKNTPIQL